MTTQKELLAEHRKELDANYRKRYPNGRFTLQRMPNYIALHWCPQRNTSHVAKKSVSVVYYTTTEYGHSVGTLQNDTFQRSSFGKCYNYDTVNKLLFACKRYEFPEKLVSSFKDRYKNRASEGFKL